MTTTPALPLLAALALAPAVAGCGGGDSTSAAPTTSQPATTTPAPTTPATGGSTPGGHKLTIGMKEFAFVPNDVSASAGTVRITARNTGNVPHELVLLKTSGDPANLPKKGGKVDESTSVGEIADVAAGETKAHAFKLKPGKYAMVCALPGHYEGGMYGSLTVR